MPVYLFYWQK